MLLCAMENQLLHFSKAVCFPEHNVQTYVWQDAWKEYQSMASIALLSEMSSVCTAGWSKLYTVNLI